MAIEKLLTPNEVASILGVKVQTLAVWRSTKRYDLRFKKVGNRVRYQEADVLEFIRRAHP